MQKKILYIDMDGVISDYENGFENFNEKTNKGLFLSFLPIEGAIEAVKILAERYEFYFLSTAPWSNPNAWGEKREWLEKYFGILAFHKLIITHNKGLLKGDYLIDDRTKNGVLEFEGEHLHFGSEKFPDWNSVLKYLMPENA